MCLIAITFMVWHLNESSGPSLDLLSWTYRQAQPGLPNSLFVSTFRSVFRWQRYGRPTVTLCTNQGTDCRGTLCVDTVVLQAAPIPGAIAPSYTQCFRSTAPHLERLVS